MPLRFASTSLCLFLLTGLALAADPKKPAGEKYDKAEADKHIFLDPAKAPVEFSVQGEYIGETEKKHQKFGIQIASLGGGNFNCAYYIGGLPGDGWDGLLRFEAVGKAANPAMTEVAFTVEGKQLATWSNGELKGVNPEGDKFEAKKVMRKSPTLGMKAPAGAIVLFDGSNTDAWEGGKTDERHLLMIGAKTKQKFKNFTLHLEFMEPYKPLGREQDRGNSGVYIQERYEVQVLDSFGEKPTFNGTGSLYRQTPPNLNMCFPPLSWQTYDIDFTSPVFENGKKVKNAVITVKLNGVAVHENRELTSKTGSGKAEGAEAGSILLQGHGNPVFYQNVWIVEKP
jgi:hypothetical protein